LHSIVVEQLDGTAASTYCGAWWARPAGNFPIQSSRAPVAGPHRWQAPPVPRGGGTIMRRIAGLLVVASVALSACGEVIPPTEPMGPSLARAGGAQEQVIVVFHENTVNPRGLAQQLAGAAGGELTHTYEHAIKGFAGSFP